MDEDNLRSGDHSPMSPKSALALFVDLPKDALAGIDLASFTVTPRFHGIKDFAPGWHFIFIGATTSFSLRFGCWFFVDGLAEEPQDDMANVELLVFRWNAVTEEVQLERDRDAIAGYCANVPVLWKDGIVSYSLPRWPSKDKLKGKPGHVDWRGMTTFITANLLQRITKTGEADQKYFLTSASSAECDVDQIPGLSETESSVFNEQPLNLLPINLKQTWREGAVGRERTDAARDRTWALNHLVTKHCQSHDDVIGELQFCFLMVLTLNNYSCLEQWKRLLELILTCSDATRENSSFYLEVLVTLRIQLESVEMAEGGLIDLSDEEGNLLKKLLRIFRECLDRQSGLGKQDIMDELDDLEEYLKDAHGWHLDDTDILKRGMLDLEDGERVEMDMNEANEEDELEPVIVDLTPEQAAALSIPAVSSKKKVNDESELERRDQQEVEEVEEADLDEMDTRY